MAKKRNLQRIYNGYSKADTIKNIDENFKNLEEDIYGSDSGGTHTNGIADIIVDHETRIDTLESAVSEDTATLKNKIGYLSNDVLGVTYENLTANSYTGTNLQSRITTAENGITSLGTRMTTAEGDIDSLEGRISTAESDIDGLETELSNLRTYTENAVDTLTDDVANCVKKTGETSQTIEGAITIGTASNNANLTVNGNINGKQITADNGLTVSAGGADITGNTVIKGDTTIGATGNAKNLTVTGNTTIGGNLTVNGTTTTIDTQSLEVADNLIVANRNGTALGTNLSGLAIKTGTGSTNNAYGIVYDAVNDVVKLGQGTVTNGDFTYNTNQGQSIATRADNIVSGHFVEWDGTNSTLVDGGAKIANKTSMGSSGSANLSLVGVDSASNLVVSKQNLFNAVTAAVPASTEEETLTTQSIIRYTYNGSTFNIVLPNDFTYNSPFYTREVTLHTAASSISITANGTTTQLTDSYQAVSSKNVTVTTDNNTDTFNITIRAKTTPAGSGTYFAMLQIGVRPLTMTSSGTAYKIIPIQDMGTISYVIPASSSSITADSPTTTLTVEGSGSVSVALDTTTKKLTITGTDTNTNTANLSYNSTNHSVQAGVDNTEAVIPIASSSALGLVKGGGNVSIDSTGKLSVTIPSADTYELVTAGTAEGTSNVSGATNGNVHLNLIKNSSVQDSHNISGSDGVSVTTAQGAITVSGIEYSATAKGVVPSTASTNQAAAVSSQSATGGRYLGEDKKWHLLPANSFKDTTYNVFTSSLNGLAPSTASGNLSEPVSSNTDTGGRYLGEDAKWHKLPANAFLNTTYTAEKGVTLSSGKFKASLVDETANDSAATRSTSTLGGLYAVELDKDNKLAVRVPWTDVQPGTLDTTNTAAQSTNANESLAGTVKLHKIAKTGTYSDLIGRPTIGSGILTIQKNGTDVATFSANDVTNSTANITVPEKIFSIVKVGNTSIEADSATDTLELVAGSNVTITPDATNDKITIAATDTTYSNATTSTAGLMSATDKSRLDTLHTNIGSKTVVTTIDTSANLATSNAIKTYVDNKEVSYDYIEIAPTAVHGSSSYGWAVETYNSANYHTVILDTDDYNASTAITGIFLKNGTDYEEVNVQKVCKPISGKSYMALYIYCKPEAAVQENSDTLVLQVMKIS